MRRIFRPIDGQGAFALDWQQLHDRLKGIGVVNGGEKRNSAIDLGVDFTAITALVSDEVQHDGFTVDFTEDVDPSNPRKAIVYIDSDGEIQKEIGQAEAPVPEGQIRFQTESPSPPTPSTTGAIIAEVWIGASAGYIDTNADVRDRRVDVDHSVHSFSADDLEAEESFTDPGGRTHIGPVARIEDLVGNQDVRDIVNSDPEHGETADHDYYTDSEARNSVIGVVDGSDLVSGSSAAGDVLTATGSGEIEWESLSGIDSISEPVTLSGDGSQTVFDIPHSLNHVPEVAAVIANSSDASGDFYLSSKTETHVQITYSDSAPASGTDNLEYDLFVGPIKARSVSDTGRRASPDVHIYSQNRVLYAVDSSGTIASGSKSTPSEVTNVIQSGINACPSSGLVHLSGTYEPASTTSITVDDDKTLSGPATIRWDGSGPLFVTRGAENRTVSLVSDSSSGDIGVSIPNNDVDSFQISDYVYVTEDRDWSVDSDDQVGEAHRIKEIDTSNSRILFDDPLLEPYSPNSNARVIALNTESAHYRNLDIVGTDALFDGWGISIEYGSQASVSDVYIDRCGGGGVSISSSQNVSVENANVTGSRSDDGTGVSITGASSHIVVRDSDIRHCTDAIRINSDDTGQPRGLDVTTTNLSENTTSNGQVIDVQGTVHDISIEDNIITVTSAGSTAIRTGARTSIINSNRVFGPGYHSVETYGIRPTGDATDRTLVGSNNVFIGCAGYHLYPTDSSPTGVEESFDMVSIKSEVLQKDCGPLVRYEPENNNASIETLHIASNTATAEAGPARSQGSSLQYSLIHLSDVVRASITDNYLADSPETGIRLDNSDQCHVVGNDIVRPNRKRGGGEYAETAIRLDNTTNSTVSDNAVFDPDGNIEYGISEYDNSDGNRLYDNQFIGPSVRDTRTVGSNTIVQQDPYTDGEARSAVEGSVDAADLNSDSGSGGQVLTAEPGSGTTWTDNQSGFYVDDEASGQVGLENGSAVVRTGITEYETRVGVLLGLSVGNNTISATSRLKWNNEIDEYEIEIFEDGTSVGNPAVRYTVIRT